MFVYKTKVHNNFGQHNGLEKIWSDYNLVLYSPQFQIAGVLVSHSIQQLQYHYLLWSQTDIASAKKLVNFRFDDYVRYSILERSWKQNF